MNNLRERSFARVLSKAGLPARDLYDCRHTYASQLLLAGANPAYIAKQCGHSIKVLLSTYAHYLPHESDRALINALPGLGLTIENLHPDCTQPENTEISVIDAEVVNA